MGKPLKTVPKNWMLHPCHGMNPVENVILTFAFTFSPQFIAVISDSSLHTS